MILNLNIQKKSFLTLELKLEMLDKKMNKMVSMRLAYFKNLLILQSSLKKMNKKNYFCNILWYEADSAAILLFALLYESGFAGILVLLLPYDADFAAILLLLLRYEADFDDILLRILLHGADSLAILLYSRMEAGRVPLCGLNG